MDNINGALAFKATLDINDFNDGKEYQTGFIHSRIGIVCDG